MTFEEFKDFVVRWSKRNSIYALSDSEKQLLKLVEEIGELAAAHVRGNKDAIEDAIGDVIVLLVNYAVMKGIRFEECFARVKAELQQRTGRINAQGVFQKDGE